MIGWFLNYFIEKKIGIQFCNIYLGVLYTMRKMLIQLHCGIYIWDFQKI